MAASSPMTTERVDARTSLMWAARDNGRNINWRDAKDYCDNYRGGGYTGWRMPTRDELERLYDNSKSYTAAKVDYEVHITELIIYQLFLGLRDAWFGSCPLFLP
jgi:hypothetical protein